MRKKETSSQKETDKKGRFFGGKKTEKRDFHSFTESCRQRKNTEKKVNEKGGIDSLEEKKRSEKKGENTRMEKQTENSEKRRKRKSEEEISSEEEFFISQNIFKKYQKETNQDTKQGFLKKH